VTVDERLRRLEGCLLLLSHVVLPPEQGEIAGNASLVAFMETINEIHLELLDWQRTRG
jgi:hypothetical protein